MADLSEHTIKTYRYLRLAMLILIAMLAASIGIEWWQAGRDCFQHSLSGYYYTPAQAIFVSTLVAIGVCMVALKGNTEWEDILLNGGGMLAPVAGLVPIPDKGECRSVPVTFRDTPADIANNMGALFMAGGLALAITLGIAIAARRAGTTNISANGSRGISGRRWAWSSQRWSSVAGSPGSAGTVQGSRRGAHYTAAIAMFVCIVGVVILNAKGFDRQRQVARRSKLPYANRYSFIAVGMVVWVVGIGLWRWLVGWDHAILWMEGGLIALFAAFWLMQTEELWHEGCAPAGCAGAREDLGTSSERKACDGDSSTQEAIEAVDDDGPRAWREREDDDVPRRLVAHREQVHRRDREEPRAAVRRRGEGRRRACLRRG